MKDTLSMLWIVCDIIRLCFCIVGVLLYWGLLIAFDVEGSLPEPGE